MSGGHCVEKIGRTPVAATGTLFDNDLIAERNGTNLYNRAFATVQI